MTPDAGWLKDISREAMCRFVVQFEHRVLGLRQALLAHEYHVRREKAREQAEIALLQAKAVPAGVDHIHEYLAAQDRFTVALAAEDAVERWYDDALDALDAQAAPEAHT
jgi:hypothetical protein